MTPERSVILLTRDAGLRFREVLDALFACRGSDAAEVLVIDSGSRDETLDIAASFPVRIHAIPPREFGHGRTRNLGASLARGNTLVFLVQDATPVDADFLELLTEPLGDPEVAGAYGRQIPRPDASPVEAHFLGHTYPVRPAVRQIGEPSERVAIRSVFFSNVCSAIRRDVWESFPFDEDLIMSEDQKWAREVLQAGYRLVYRPEAAVLHSHAYPLSKVVRRNFDSGHSLVGVVQDRPVDMARYQLRFLISGIARLVRQRKPLSIPHLILHELARSLGFLLGRNARRLPLGWRRALSLHRAHWEHRDDHA